MCNQCERTSKAQRAREAATSARSTERAVLELVDAIPRATKQLSALQLKLTGGERLKEEDREVLQDRLQEVLNHMMSLVGQPPPKHHAADNERAQQVVEDYVQQLIDDGEITFNTAQGLQSKDPSDRSTRTITWQESLTRTVQQSVTVSIPDAILEDDDLMNNLESEFHEHHDSLMQDPEVVEEENNCDLEISVEG